MTKIPKAHSPANASRELHERMLSRTILSEPIVLFRKTDRTVVALQDRCAHRFVSDDLFGMKPALLQTDRAAVRARRLLESMIRHECEEEVEPPAIDSEPL